MSLAPYETEIVGKWEIAAGRVAEDKAAHRIKMLIRDELKAVETSTNGWDRLFIDPSDNRYWELTFPHTEMHGGGPPTLRVLDEELARKKYRLP